MKFKLAFLLVLVSLFSYSQYTKIPDINFEKKLIELGFDSGLIDGKVKTANIINVEKLAISGSNITNLTGIQDFKNLEDLRCSSNKLKILDLSKNLKLLSLNCGFNELTSLNVTQNITMYSLSCASNSLTNLDLSKNTGLTFLDCSSNKLTNVDISKNMKLEILVIRRTGLINLDLSKNSALKSLDCGDNKLTSLEFFNNSKIQRIACESNKITSLDFSKNRELYSLMCADNDLQSLNIKNVSSNFGLEAKMNPKLQCITVDDVDMSIANKSWSKDAKVNYSLNCSNDVGTSGNREAIQVMDSPC